MQYISKMKKKSKTDSQQNYNFQPRIVILGIALS